MTWCKGFEGEGWSEFSILRQFHLETGGRECCGDGWEVTHVVTSLAGDILDIGDSELANTLTQALLQVTLWALPLLRPI